MLMVVCSNLRRPGHVGAASAARNINWLISGGYTPPIRAVARQYVQAPEARPVPDERYPGSQQDRKDIATQTVRSSKPKDLRPPTPPSPSQTLNSSTLPPPMSDQDADPNLDVATGVAMPYNIDWIFPRLRNPSKFWYVVSQFVVSAVGIFSKVVLMLLNKPRVYNKERLIQLITKRPKGVPLVTVSNHYSCFDDPGLWGCLPLGIVCNTYKIRWSMAAHDICFTNKLHSLFFMFGKCIPVVRGIGVYQDAINLCIEKAALGHWIHVFPEGKVNMEKEELRLKWGVGRIIYESPKIPIILPMWHEGMDELLPNVEPYVIQRGKQVTLNVGQPLDLNDFILDLKKRQVPEPTARKLITDKIQEAFRDLRAETEKLHRERN
ncbi:tafazzin homolog [Drosophila sechellia]|uniref:Tafazzin family protein n=1 Tax=Drosophila sechellia TaxID=7238 RepID=B4HPN9_DROSE|nr:tafazzin homolog [Drosophila sechellia]EDW47623.1 GM20337 [Drosophila sechellia]